MNVILGRHRRRKRKACAPPSPPSGGCICKTLRHPVSWEERERLQEAAAEAERLGKRDLLASLQTRLSTPCRTCKAAAAQLAGADWLEAGVQ